MNRVTSWQYEKPTEPGIYLCCYGDVESAFNLWLLTITESGEWRDLTISGVGALEKNDVSDHNKYAQLEFNDE